MGNSLHYLLLLWLMTPTFADALDEKEHLTIQAGEVEVVSFGEPVQVQLSRRGVVFADSANGRQWQVTGLRRGVVVARFQNRLGELVRSMVITVESEPPVRSLLQRGRFPVELCSFAGVVCRPEEGLIEGEVHSYHWLYYAKNRCLDSQVCRFAVTLSQQARRVLEGRIYDALPPDIALVSAGPGGTVNIAGNCIGSPEESWQRLLLAMLAGLGVEDQVTFTCQHPSSGEALWLQYYIVQELHRDQFLQGWPDLSAKNHAILRPDSYQGWLDLSKMQRQGFQLLSSPAVQIIPGKRIELVTGSELRIDARGEGDSYVQWKPLGIRVEATLHGGTDGRLLASALMLTGQAAQSSQISQSRLVTKIPVAPGVKTLLGTMDLEQRHDSKELSTLISRIPIVSPLFRRKAGGSSRSRVLVYARIDYLDDASQHRGPDRQKDKSD